MNELIKVPFIVDSSWYKRWYSKRYEYTYYDVLVNEKTEIITKILGTYQIVSEIFSCRRVLKCKKYGGSGSHKGHIVSFI